MVGGVGWLEKLDIKLSQLPTKLKLKLSLAKIIPVTENILYVMPHNPVANNDIVTGLDGQAEKYGTIFPF